MESRALYIVACLLVGALAAPQPEVQRSIEDSEVGHLFSNTRIVGGEEAPDGSVPWMVALTSGSFLRSFFCGASLIGGRHVLTAAHCIDVVWTGTLIGPPGLMRSTRVHVGSNTWRGESRYRVSRNISHPNYVFEYVKNDIALLITDEEIELNERVAVIPLNLDHIYGEEDVMIAGFGRTEAGGPLASSLKRLFLKTLDSEECMKQIRQHADGTEYDFVFLEPHIELCTIHSPGQGTCNGDSGSALVHVGTNTQVGVVSWGFPCAIGAPDMFARVSAFKDFLQEGLKVIK